MFLLSDSDNVLVMLLEKVHVALWLVDDDLDKGIVLLFEPDDVEDEVASLESSKVRVGMVSNATNRIAPLL